ncbi:MAG: thiamine pyrophosphate-dependent enzyme, partial [Candidatus Thalassarchaeaceae archaeon]
LSFGLGCALSAKLDSSDRKIWVMLGDGETQEGQIWEAAMAASYHNVSNLRVIVDRNRIQNDDFMDLQMEIGDIGDKFRSFGWTVEEVDGHDMESLVRVVDWANKENGSPVAIIANTIKGSGVSFMENNPSFHGKAPDDEELRIALEELS